VGIFEFCAFAKDAVELQSGPFVDVNVRADTFFSYREIFSRVVDRNGANTVDILAAVGL